MSFRLVWLVGAAWLAFGCGESRGGAGPGRSAAAGSAASAGHGASRGGSGPGVAGTGAAMGDGSGGGDAGRDGGGEIASGGTSAAGAPHRGHGGHGGSAGGVVTSGRGGSGVDASAGEADDGDSAGNAGKVGDAGDAGAIGAAGGTGGIGNAGAAGAGADEVPDDELIPNWSVHKRLRASDGDFTLEEVLQGFAVDAAAASRIRKLTAGAPDRVWLPPAGVYMADFCRHPSGQLSVVLIAEDRSVSLARLAPDLTLLWATAIHDPEIANDPHAAGSGITELFAAGFALDAAHVAAIGESAVVSVMSSGNAVIAYRLAFTDGVWSAPERTLLEPAHGLTPNIPIGGSFDTFGAMGAWFRAAMDVDEAGNVYVVIWAGAQRISSHLDVFHDGVAALPGDPDAPNAHDSDLLLSKMSPDGTRLWSRVVGSEHEDEPYAIRAHAGFVAVVGRSRRFPGFDNTVWDALLSVSTTDGDLVGTRTIPLNASGILLAVDSRPEGGWLLGGSDGWSQNPDGLSVLSFGKKALLELGALDGEPVRHDLAAGPRHNEIRSVVADAHRLWFGGHEDGPIMHTGDADPTQIYATGVLGSLAR